MQSQHIATGDAESPNNLIKFKNCRILRNHKIIKEDLWVRSGKIIDPEKVFFDEKRQAHLVSDPHSSSSIQNSDTRKD
jgi:hypothetical protein